MKNKIVIWNQEILVPIELPISKDNLDFELYDYDGVGSDELVANMTFSKKEIIRKVGGDPNKRKFHTQWFNLYGCNPSKDNKISKEQNADSEKSTTFKGRVLVEFSCIDMENPTFKI